jgi:hypothetical protein
MTKRTRPKGYAAWTPREHTLALIGQVREILRGQTAYLPLTARQVFYRLVGAYGYPKDENAYERLCNALGRARRAGIIPFEDLRDDGAVRLDAGHYEDPDTFYGYVRRLGASYERDKLARQRVDMRVYCEAAGMMQQLARACQPYSVPVYSCSGFDSLTAKYDLAQRCVRTFVYRGKSTVILHLGDHDPSGVSIYESMKEDVHAFVAGDLQHVYPEAVVSFERVALTLDQVAYYDLTTYPPKATDLRSGRWSGETCQLEALPPDVLAGELDDAIRRHLDRNVLIEDREAEALERRQIAKALPSAD